MNLELLFLCSLIGAVVFKGTSDFSAVIKDQDKLIAQNIKLKEKLKEVTDESKKQDEGFKGALTNGVNQVKSMVTGYFSLQGAIQLVNAALAEQNRLSEMAQRVQMTAADAQAEVIKNLGNVTTAHASRFLSDVQQISKDAGAESVAPVLQAAASTLSGTGGNEALTKSILAEAVPLFKNKLSELPDFAGAVADLASITGAESQNEIRKTVGLVLTTQSQARITSLGAFKNVAPAMAAIAATDTGEDRTRALKEGGAAFAAIGGSIKDPEGSITKTATSRLGVKLQELLPENDVLDLAGNVTRKGTGLKTLAERLQRVQGDDRLQREFLLGSDTFAKATFEGPVMPVISDLISRPDSEVSQRFSSAMTNVQDDPEVVNQMLANLASATPQLATANITREAAGNVEGIQMTGDAARRAAARGILQTTAEQTRAGALGFIDDKRLLTKFDMGFGGDSPEESAISQLRDRESLIRNQFNRGTAEKDLPQDQREDLDLIRKQIALLERMASGIDGLKQNTGPVPLNANREGR